MQAVNAAFSYAFAPSTEYRINVQADRSQWSDGPVDSLAQFTNRLLRTQVCPDPSETYKLRIRATNSKSLTVLGAKVVSVVKSGTTTGTFTTAAPPGLVTGDGITYYGNSNTAASAFPNLTAATAVTVINATTFQATIGTASSATGYGGVISKVQGGNLPSALGANNNSAINATLSTLADGTRQLALTGAASWAGLLIGDYIEAVGVTNVLNGTSLGVDGAWKVANAATTVLTLVPATPAFAATLPANFGLTTSAGAVVKRTCLRVSFVRMSGYDRERVEVLARPSGDISGAAPVAVQNVPAVSISGAPSVAGSVAVDAAISNPVTVGLRASNANIAAMSAAGDNVAALGTMIGVAIVKPFALPEAGWNASVALTTTAAVALQTAGGAGLRRYVTAVQAINTGAGPTDLIVLDGATERWRIPLPANIPVSFEFPTELVTTANTALNANLSAAVTSVRINAQGYTAP